MSILTIDQLAAIGKKCSYCDKPATWIAHRDSPSYCDDHFPYWEFKENDKSFDAPTNDPGDAENFKKTEYDGESLHNLVNQRNY